MTSKKKKAALMVLIVFVLFILFVVTNPLRWPEPLLRSYVLYNTPIDSKFDKVERIIKKKNWEIAYTDKSKGFWDQRSSSNKKTGVMSIRASLGDYQGIPFVCNVTVFWGFNAEGNLIDIWVWKTWDGI